MSHRCIFALAFLLAPLTALAQGPYTIKLKEIGQGESSRVEIKGTMNSKNTTKFEKEKDGKTEEFTGTKHFAYTDIVLERPAGAPMPTKVKRVYQNAVQTAASSKAKEERTAPYSGKTVLIERSPTGYDFRIEGGAILARTDVPELDQEFNREERAKVRSTFLPPGAVAEGQSWQIDAKPLLGVPDKDPNTQIVRSSGTAKLVKVYKKDGRLFGIIEVSGEVQFKSMFKGKQIGEVSNTDMTGSMKITFDGCIDGSVASGRMYGTLQFNGMTTGNTPGIGAVTNSSSGISNVEDTWMEVKK